MARTRSFSGDFKSASSSCPGVPEPAPKTIACCNLRNSLKVCSSGMRVRFPGAGVLARNVMETRVGWVGIAAVALIIISTASVAISPATSSTALSNFRSLASCNQAWAVRVPASRQPSSATSFTRRFQNRLTRTTKRCPLVLNSQRPWKEGLNC